MIDSKQYLYIWILSIFNFHFFRKQKRFGFFNRNRWRKRMHVKFMSFQYAHCNCKVKACSLIQSPGRGIFLSHSHLLVWILKAWAFYSFNIQKNQNRATSTFLFCFAKESIWTNMTFLNTFKILALSKNQISKHLNMFS